MKAIFKSLITHILTFESKVVLKRHKPKIIVLVGSVGKTSTKDAIFCAIKNHTSARKSEKSFNSVDIGVQLTVLGLSNGWNNPFIWLKNIVEGFIIAFFSKDYPDILVLETGIDRPGDMDMLSSWLKPDIAVLTRLPDVPAHVEFFGTTEALIEEKMKLINALNLDGVLVYNNDDEVIKKLLPEVLQKQVGYGRYLKTDFTARADSVVYKDDQPVGIKFSVKHGDKVFPVRIANTIGTQHVYSATAAMAVADLLGVPLEGASGSLGDLKAPNGRMKIIPGIKSTTLIDDTYNSSPIAVEQAIQALNELKYTKRRILVLGDMLELGKYSSAEHKRIGSLVPGVADILFTVGVRSRQIAEGALVAGMSEKNIFQYDDIVRAGKELQAIMQIGDAILIKASQGIRAERIVEEVMFEPDSAPKLLVRQDEKWLKIK